MTNVHAALLLGQLQLYEEIKNIKINIFNKYKQYLTGIPGIFWQEEEPGCSHSNWMFGVRVEGNSSYKKSKHFFDQKGIETRPLFYPITHHKHLSHIKSTTKIAEQLNNECIILPSYPELTDLEIEYISDCVKKYNNIK
jgi:perosamine synthetase